MLFTLKCYIIIVRKLLGVTQMEKYPWKDKQWLEEQMNKYGSGKAIARETGYAETSIHRYLKKYGLNEPQQLSKCSDKNWLIKQYQNGKTIREIAMLAGSSTRTVLKYNEKYNLNPNTLNPNYQKDYYEKEWLEEQVRLYGNGLAISKATGYPANSLNRWINHYGLVERKYMTKQKCNQNDNFFEVIDTEEKAYWLGFIMADGNMYERSNPIGSRYTLSIKLKSTDLEHLEKFKQAIEYDGEIKIIASKRRDTETFGAEIRINSFKMCTDLIGHGIAPRKSGKECIPKTIPNELAVHFIRGFIDGDGHIGGSMAKGRVARVCVDSSSKTVVNQIAHWFCSNSNLIFCFYKRGNMYSCKTQSKSVVYETLKIIYSSSTVYLTRKYNKAQELISEYEKTYMSAL